MTVNPASGGSSVDMHVRELLAEMVEETKNMNSALTLVQKSFSGHINFVILRSLLCDLEIQLNRLHERRDLLVFLAQYKPASPTSNTRGRSGGTTVKKSGCLVCLLQVSVTILALSWILLH